MKQYVDQVANNVSVKINSEFIDNVPKNGNLSQLCKSSFTLGIDKSYFVSFGVVSEYKRTSNVPLKINVCYSDRFSNYSEATVIDLKQCLWSLIYDSPAEDTSQEMKKIANSIQSMDHSIQKFQTSIGGFLTQIKEKLQ